ncbi:MAG: 3-dehydroquinate synthase [bacterium]|jgi:3-dehydroquinate synthase|nr:3-dehydroquinate synthase [bacterium]
MHDAQTDGVIHVGLGDRSYPITVGSGILDTLGSVVRSHGFRSPLAVITDDRVASLYGERALASLREAGFEASLLIFPEGEPSKTLQTIASLYDGMVKLKPERKSGLIALGGGVAGDMAGFVAATYLRGMPFIQVPTTLLAQVDSSVGGKVGVDHAGGKNLIGAFHQPVQVLIDTATLKTLDPRQVKAGLAEVIKHGVIRDERLFEKIKTELDSLLRIDERVYQEIVPWNCRIKAQVVEQDEREHGLRAILNFGHTIGHAIESLTGYETYLHGEAVALGMWMEARLGCRLGITPLDVVASLESLLRQVGYPLERPSISGDQLVESMYHDKKVEEGTLRFIFPTRIGDVGIHAVQDVQSIKKVWEESS